MAIVLSSETIQHTIERLERTTAVHLNTNSSRDTNEYSIDIVREVATYQDGGLTGTSRNPVAATPSDGGFVDELHMTVGELHTHAPTRKIVMDDGREIELTDLLEIISKGCDIVSEIRREERRAAAASQA